MRLVRSASGLPLTETDGDVLIDTATGGSLHQYYYTDTFPTEGIWYYYAVFVFRADLQVWIRSGGASTVARKNYGNPDSIFSLLPSVYQDADSNRDAGGNGYLSRFLQLCSGEFDTLRTEVDSLTQAPVAELIFEPYMLTRLAEFGLTPETEIRASNQRLLLHNLAEFYGAKGTSLTAAGVARAVTGWATSLAIGPNLMLDELDATFDGALGRWRATAGSVSYRPGDGVINAPYGRGIMDMKNVSGGAATATTVVTTGQEANLNGIPVTVGVSYTAQASFRGAARLCTLRITWYNAAGTVLSSNVGSGVMPNSGNWFVTASVTATAPANAATAALTISAAALLAAEHMYVSQVQFGNAATLPTVWVPARQARFTFKADLINYLPNPRFGAGAVTGWVQTVNEDVLRSGAILTAGTTPSPETLTSAQLTTSFATQGTSTATAALYPETLYSTSIWLKSTIAGTVWFRDVTNGIVISKTFPGDNTWREVHLSLVTGIQNAVLRTAVTLTGAGSAYLTAASIVQGEPIPYFDGAIPSPTADYMWEGAAHASPSHFYYRRAITASRIRALLPKFLPTSAETILLFGQSDIPPVGITATHLYPARYQKTY